MGGMKRSYEVIRKGMIRDARWQTMLVQKPYNSKHIVFANKSLPVLIGHRCPKTKHCVSISRPPSIQSIPACVSLDQFVQYPNRTDWIGWSHLWVRMSFPMFQLIVTELWSACPISQSVGPLPNFGLRSCLLVLVVGAVWTWWRGRGTCSNWLLQLRSVWPISQSVGLKPNFGLWSSLQVLGVKAVWTWWRGQCLGHPLYMN